MLRSLDLIRQTARPSSLVAGGEGHVTLLGEGIGYAKPWHWHDGLMLLLPSYGAINLKHEASRGGAWVSEDCFAVVPAFHAHDTSALRADQRHIAVYVEDAALRRVEAQLGSLDRIRASIRTITLFPVSPEIRTLRALCRDDCGDAFGSRAVRAHLAAALLIRCLAAIERERPLPSASRHDHGAALVREAQAFVAARLDRDVPLDTLAERLGLSRRHLTRLFHAKVGGSIGAFHRAKRLEAAAGMLTATDLPVDEIASRVGFESGSALSRALRRRDGQAATGLRASASAATARPVATRGPPGRATGPRSP